MTSSGPERQAQDRDGLGGKRPQAPGAVRPGGSIAGAERIGSACRRVETVGVGLEREAAHTIGALRDTIA